MKKIQKSLLPKIFVSLVIITIVFTGISVYPLLFSNLTRSQFNFNTIKVDGEVTADAETENIESLSVYQQPLFNETSRAQAANKLSAKKNIASEQQIEFNFYWNGIIEQYYNPYLDYSNPEFIQYIKSDHINDMAYNNYAEYHPTEGPLLEYPNNNFPILLQEHHFVINYMTLNFTNSKNERVLVQKGLPEIPSFYPEVGCYTSGGGIGSQENSGFVMFTRVPRNCDDWSVFDDYVIDPIDVVNDFVIPQEDFSFEVFEDGMNINIKTTIDSSFDAQKVDISTIQIIGVQKNEDKKIRFFMLNFSSFGRNEKLSLSTIGTPFSVSISGRPFDNTETKNLYYDHYSKTHINSDNEINIGFFKTLSILTSEGFKDINETIVIFSNDPLVDHFDELNFLGQTNFSDVIDQFTVRQDMNGLYSDENVLGAFGDEILDGMKPIAIIEFQLSKDNIFNFSIDISTPNSTDYYEFNEPIFDSVFNFNTGIKVSDESYLMPMMVVGTGNQFNLQAETYEMSIYLDASRIQKVQNIKEIYKTTIDLVKNPDILFSPPMIYPHIDLKIYYWGMLTTSNNSQYYPRLNFYDQDFSIPYEGSISTSSLLVISHEVIDNDLILFVSSVQFYN